MCLKQGNLRTYINQVCNRTIRPLADHRGHRYSHQSVHNQLISVDGEQHSRVNSVAGLLREYEFTDSQIQSVLKSIGRYIAEENGLNKSTIRATIDSWNRCLKPPKLKAKQWDKISPEDIDYDLSVDLNQVLSKIEPKLLLINANAVEHRIESIKQLAVFGGARDLWRVLVYAPNGYYLQSWSDFLKKYHYLNFRVLEWLLDKKDKDNLHPHPLIRNARVMELPFETIRCRYLFAKRTGLKTNCINNKLSNEDKTKIDLRALMLLPIDKYLKLVAQNCSIEEYSALEALLNEMPPEEEEQLIEDIIELTVPHQRSVKTVTTEEKNVRLNNTENNFQIINQID